MQHEVRQLSPRFASSFNMADGLQDSVETHHNKERLNKLSVCLKAQFFESTLK